MGAEPRWRVYYADGSTYADTDGPLENTPGTGVQVIRYRQACGTPATCAAADYYCWHKGQWWNRDDFGMKRHLAAAGWKKVIFGEVIETDAFQRIRDLAVNDPDFKPLKK